MLLILCERGTHEPHGCWAAPVCPPAPWRVWWPSSCSCGGGDERRPGTGGEGADGVGRAGHGVAEAAVLRLKECVLRAMSF